MPVIDYDNGELLYFGTVIYGSDKFSNMESTTLNIASDIADLINDINGFGDTTFFGIQWQLILNADTILSNADLFKSALGKYDLGVVNYLWNGVCTGEEYWNFKAQRCRYNKCWWTDDVGDYPSVYNPTPTIGSFFQTLAIYSTGQGYPYACGVAIKPTYADASSMSCTVIWSTFASNEPEDEFLLYPI